MHRKLNAEIRRVTVINEDKVDIGFVFVHPGKDWRTSPGFDTLSGHRLERFMAYHECSSVEELKELAPPHEWGIGQTPAENPVWIPIRAGGPGPDFYSINTNRLPEAEEET